MDTRPLGRRWAAVVAASVLLVCAAPAGAGGPAPADAEARYDAARDQYETGHFQAAFAEFAALADGGHCPSARIALQMLRYGKSLYATEFKVALERVQRWQHLPACDAALARR